MSSRLGPDIESVLALLIKHPGRASAEVVFHVDESDRRYRISVWRNGNIVFRPLK